ncbi:MAG: hypothetical protein ABI702_05740 [Burkholderiales bacterium]
MLAAVSVLRIVAIVGLLATGGAALAGSAELEVEAPDGPLSCLESSGPSGAMPSYPAGMSSNVVVRVRMRFTSASAPPVVDVRFNNGAEAFADAVRKHVAGYRLPCLAAGLDIDSVQEFQFMSRVPEPAVLKSAARNPDGSRALPESCMAGVLGVQDPEFPSSLVTPVKAGNVLVRLTFAAPDLPPAADVLYDSEQPRLRAAVLDSVRRYRMPCLVPGDSPLVVSRAFMFKYDSAQTPQFKSTLTLQQLIRAVKGFEQQKVRFDFGTMGCPFQVSVAPYQPYANNRVQEVGDRKPDRREFLEWLRNVTFDFPPAVMRTAMGEPTTVSVPCAVLDLS